MTRGDSILLRLGEIPEAGVSRNHRDDVLEAGVSCYRASYLAPDDPATDYSWALDRAGLDPVSTSIVVAAARDRRAPLYRLHGEIVGRGSDGEPLVRVERAERLSGDAWDIYLAELDA